MQTHNAMSNKEGKIHGIRFNVCVYVKCVAFSVTNMNINARNRSSNAFHEMGAFFRLHPSIERRKHDH